MASMCITESAPPRICQLSVQSYSWAQVDIGDLAGCSQREVLTGATVELGVARADPEGQVGDLIPTYWSSLYLVSDQFVEVMTKATLTGWRTLPIQVTGNEHFRDVSLLQVLGRCGPIVKEGDWLLQEEGDRQCLSVSTWDGSDLFVPENRRMTLLSPRAAETIQGSSLRNVTVDDARIEILP